MLLARNVVCWMMFLAASVMCNDQFQKSQDEFGANPMRKIISMLQDMAKELEREGEVEKELFEKALCACEGGEKELQKTIDDSSAAIEQYTASVQGDKAQHAGLSQEVEQATANVDSATHDLATATALRDKEHKIFVAKEKSSKLNLDNLNKAIPAIEAGMGGAALVQMPGLPKFTRFLEVTKHMTSDDRTKVLAFLDQGSDSGSSTESSSSGEIVGILKSLKDSMQADLTESQGDEQRDHEGYTELKGAKEEEIRVTNQAIIEKGKRLGTLAVSLSEGEHALKDATEELAEAQTFKANMKEECAERMKTRDERAKMRSEEIAAVSEAVEILNNDDALEVFSKAKKSALVQQQPKKTYEALLQFTGGKAVSQRSFLTMKARVPGGVPEGFDKPIAPTMPSTTPPPTPKPIQLGAAIVCDDGGDCKDLRSEGSEAEKLVTHMVDGMVSVLHDEDVGDEHKADWCHNETIVVHDLHATKSDLIGKTTSDISQQKDHIAELTQKIDDLTAKIAELDKLVHETTEQRKEEHQEFVDSFATSATAIRLVDKAMVRLERFYSPQKIAKKEAEVKAAALKKEGLALNTAKSRLMKALGGGFDAFLQVKERAMQIPDTPETYEKKESGGIIGLMNDFKTDLKTDMTEAETEEKFDAKEYVRIMSDAQASRKQDVRSMNEKKSAKANVEEKLVANKELLHMTKEELHNLELYQLQLKTECDFLLRNFDNRHEGRVESEVGLSGAETIVSGGTPPNHNAIESRFEAETSDSHVDTNFPGTPVSDVQPVEAPPPKEEGLDSLR